MSLFWRGYAGVLVVTVCLFIGFGADAAARDDASAVEPEPASSDVKARLEKLTQIQQDLRDDKPAKAAEKLREFAKGMTPELALAIIREVGYKPFEGLIAQGGDFRRTALNISALARHATFEELTDPEAIRTAVSDFLEGGKKSGPAYRLLKDRVGEFSVQYLLEAWNKSSDYGVKAQIEMVLTTLGPRVVPPMIAALDTDDALLKTVLIEVLSKHGDWRAAAKLLRIAADENMTRATRQVAMKACDRIVRAHLGAGADKYSAAQLYAMIAEDYLANRSSKTRNVIPRYYLNEGTKFFTWSMRDGALIAGKIPRFAYNYEMAITMAARAIELDPSNQRASDVIVCARLAEIAGGQMILDYDEAMKNDLLTEAERDAISAALDSARAGRPKALARGLRSLCGALHLALNYRLDAAAVECVDAIAAVPAALYMDFIPADEKEANTEEKYGDSLTLALGVGSRMVRFRAAIALTRIASSKRFVNMELVPDLLLKAMEETGAVRVLVVHPDAETRNLLRLSLGALGYEAVLAGDSAEGIAAARDFPAPDIIIAHNRLDLGTDHFIVTLRDNRATSETPMLIISRGDEESLKDDKIRFSYDTVKGFIVNPADEETLAKQLSAFKKAGSWEVRQNLITVRAAAEALSALDPRSATLDLLPYVDRIIALARGQRDLTARVSAMVALGNWRFDKALKPARVVLADASAPRDLRAAAARAIGLILHSTEETDEETFGILLAALGADDPAISDAAGRALASAPLTAEQRSRIPEK